MSHFLPYIALCLWCAFPPEVGCNISDGPGRTGSLYDSCWVAGISNVGDVWRDQQFADLQETLQQIAKTISISNQIKKKEYLYAIKTFGQAWGR